ncbi:MAG TPA: TetR/AcrR family transcriptional regulator [Solirubrobacteraceae bacterium]|jgi:AcrR family transcriptional regulator|nr:TetR/AcrR family transcriptional regulator [Solirubrobacteraceae bacterium]
MQARADAVEATRARLMQAGLDAFEAQPYDAVTIAAVARAAGVSHQTLLNHFGSKEGLYLALVDSVGDRIAELRATAMAGDDASIVGALMDQYEAFGDGNARAATLNERIPAVAAMLERARGYHQEWLAEMFADRLPAAEPARREALAALHAATDVFTWRLLRRDLGLSREATTDVITRLLAAGLQHEPPYRGESS